MLAGDSADCESRSVARTSPVDIPLGSEQRSQSWRTTAGTLPDGRPPYFRLPHGPVGQQIPTPRNLDRRLHAPDKRDCVQYRVRRTPQPSFLPNSGAERGERDRGAEQRNRASDSPRQSRTAPTGNCSSDAHERFRSKSCALANDRCHLVLGARAGGKTVQRVETIRRSTFRLWPFL
jgi:hypothetical protein